MTTKHKYVPAQDRPTSFPIPIGEHHDFIDMAWYNYWKMVRSHSKKAKCSEWDAHVALQAKYPFDVPDFGEEFTRADDFIVLFMLQFEVWQRKSYDTTKIFRDEAAKRQHLDKMIGPKTTLPIAFALCDRDLRDGFVSTLWCGKHKHILEQLVDDPIYGTDAKNELRNLAMSQDFAITEVFRRSALPENIIRIDKILETCNPSCYSVHFPYPINQFHSVPNCLCVMADGGPIFRLEVLDPAECTRFKLAEMKDPWWGLHAEILHAPAAGEGEYDFPFYDFNIVEGDEFDIEKLIEVIERGAEQIGTRSKRKWGRD